MADLDPAHVEAVARVLTAAIDTSPRQRTGISHNARLRQARALLRSDTPAVHAALLAALVRAGVLTEEPTIECTEDGSPTYYVGWGSRATYYPRRRYVTRWEETCD